MIGRMGGRVWPNRRRMDCLQKQDGEGRIPEAADGQPVDLTKKDAASIGKPATGIAGMGALACSAT